MKKKILLVATAISMMAALSACGDEGATLKKSTTEEVVTTEATTAATTEDVVDTEEEVTEDETTEDETTVADVSDDDLAGYENLNDVYFLVGDLTEYANQSGTVVYANADRTETLAIYTERNGVYSEEQVLQAYADKIKSVYGDNFESTYFVTDQFAFDEYDYLDGNNVNSDADVKTYVYSDGKTTIYLEHVTIHGTEFPSTAEDLMNSIIIK